MSNTKKYILNSLLEFIEEDNRSLVIDEENCIVHFLGELETEILFQLKEPITFEDLQKHLSSEYVGYNQTDLEMFLQNLVEKNIIVKNK